MKSYRSTRSNQQGFAALIIAIVLVIVLSLITVGFADLMRHEQRSALDRQLSNSAYYAAESGINDASRAIAAGYNVAKRTCGAATSGDVALNPAAKYLTNNQVDSAIGTEYSCLLINPNPSTLEYSSVGTNQATTVVVTGSDASGNPLPISKLVFSWQDASGGTQFAPPNWFGGSACSASSACFFPATNWTYIGSAVTGILRASLTPLTFVDRNWMENNTYTGFFYPVSGNAEAISALSINPYTSGTASGDIVNGNCNTGNSPRYCEVAIDVSSQNQATYLIHLSSLYRNTEVTVTPFDSSNNQIYLKGAQTLVDSTGKAQDVLKRIQVRIPARNAYDYPEFDLQTGNNICKQLAVYPPNNATGTPGNANAGGCSSL